MNPQIKGSAMNLKSLSFFTVVDDSEVYQDFVTPFIASALITHPGAFCEVRVPNVKHFYERYDEGIRSLYAMFPEEYIVLRWPTELADVRFSSQPCAGAFIRFLTVPCGFGKYTYISDVDMLFVQDILDDNISVMEKTGLPYATIVRPGSKRLAGCYMVESIPYYTAMKGPISDYIEDPELIYYPIHNDEELLYKLVELSGLGLPPEAPEFQTGKYRPISAVHTSIHRTMDGERDVDGNIVRLSWGLCEEKIQGVRRLFADERWKKVVFPVGYTERVINPLMEKINA